MRVLSVIESLLHGGAETVLVDLVRGLTACEHDVAHFTGSYGAEAAPWILAALADAGATCRDLPRAALRDRDGRAPRLGADPDVVVHHWWGSSSFDPWPHPDRRPAFVLVVHTSRAQAPAGYDAYVLVSETQRSQVQAVDPARVVVIPNGVDVARFATTTSARRKGFTVGRLSNLRHEKIGADCVRMLAALDLSDTTFVIAGDGPLRAGLIDDARALGVEPSVLFPGYVERDNVPALLGSFDVFCYTVSTAVECHPLALLEACAAGLPIVAEARGGVPDIVQDGVNGYLLRDRDELAPVLRRLRDDRALRDRMGAASRAIAARFGIERQAAAYAALFQRVVS